MFSSSSRKPTSAFTLAEVVVSLALAGVAFAAILAAYNQAAYRAEWSGYSLAAQGLAVQQIEQAKCAKWDVLDTPPADEINNIRTNAALNVTVTNLDLPITGTNYVLATNYTTITSVTNPTIPSITVYLVRVDTVWPFTWRNRTRYFTNTIADYFAPD